MGILTLTEYIHNNETFAISVLCLHILLNNKYNGVEE